MGKFKRIITAAAAAVIFTAAMPFEVLAAESDGRARPSFQMPRFGFSKGAGGLELMQIPVMGSVKRAEGGDKLPAKYSLRGSETLTPVRDQTGFGTCWAHSAAASAESSIAARVPYIDLSEFHTAFYSYFDGTIPEENVEELFDRGGNCYYVGNKWAQWSGPVSERRLKYGDTDFLGDEGKVGELARTADYHLRSGYMFDYDRERTNEEEINGIIKAFILDGVAVDVSFCSDPGRYYDPEHNSANSPRKPRFADHSVAIVGWDDDFPAEDFTIPAEKDGAWLVKNSWGSDFGDEGFMWISYEDRSLCEFSAFILNDADEYTKLFCHDTYVPVQSMAVADDPAQDEASYAASIFTADERTQIEAVSVFISQPGMEYEITVYTGLTDDEDPVSGTPSVTTKGVCALTGYETLELDTDVIVEEGEDFAVVVKLRCPDTPFVVPVESCYAIDCGPEVGMVTLGGFASYEQIEGSLGEGESMYSVDGVDWEDMYGSDYLLSDEEEQLLLEQLEEELFDGIEPDETDLLENARSMLELYTDLIKDGDVHLILGNISIKALGNPVNTPDLSIPSGRVGADETVTVSTKSGEQVWISVNGGEYIPYTEPLTITGKTDISATVDFKTYARRTYVPHTFTGRYGDADGNGSVDSADASLVLAHYSAISTGNEPVIGRFMEEFADINGDGALDSADASAILALYAEISTGAHEQT